MTTRITTDHEEIRRWVESRKGMPSAIKGTGSTEDPGVLKIHFSDEEPEEELEEISWEDFFEKFEDGHLSFVCQEETPEGSESRFFRFVRRDEYDEGTYRDPDEAEASGISHEAEKDWLINEEEENLKK